MERKAEADHGAQVLHKHFEKAIPAVPEEHQFPTYSFIPVAPVVLWWVRDFRNVVEHMQLWLLMMMMMMMMMIGKALFFRPSPSRLSPGRNTVFVPLNELCKVLYVPALGSSTRKKTSQQPKQKPKNTQTKQNQPPKSPHSDGRALEQEGQLVCR